MDHRASPTVSVVVPAYNAGRTIGDAIQSVLDGAFSDFEIVVCDDASVDNTVDVVESFGDPRIRLMRNATNSGEGVTRDNAIAASAGAWVAMLDADDAFSRDRLAVLMEVVFKHPSSIVFDEVMECHDTSLGMRPWKPVRRFDCYPGVPEETRQITFVDWMSNASLVNQPIIPTRIIRDHDVRHSTSRSGADAGFRCRLLALSKAQMWYVPRAMYLYRRNPGSATTTVARHELLAHELGDALPLFRGNPSAVRALAEQIRRCQRNAEYQRFFSAIVHGELGKSAREATRNPWVLPEFARRAAEQVPYHLSRLRNGGKRKQTS